MFRYKKNTTNGQDYMQIWEDGEYRFSLGTAESLYKKLVKAQKIINQTKEMAKNLTKDSNMKQEVPDQNCDDSNEGGVLEEKKD